MLLADLAFFAKCRLTNRPYWIKICDSVRELYKLKVEFFLIFSITRFWLTQADAKKTVKGSLRKSKILERRNFQYHYFLYSFLKSLILCSVPNFYQIFLGDWVYQRDLKTDTDVMTLYYTTRKEQIYQGVAVSWKSLKIHHDVPNFDFERQLLKMGRLTSRHFQPCMVCEMNNIMNNNMNNIM